MGKSKFDKFKKAMPKVDLKAKRVYYPGEDQTHHFVRKCKTPAPSTGRKCIVPGSIVILLSGRFRGKRVVVLKRLESGLLLVNGPYKVNGVPLKRVNPAYVIPTSTKLNVAGCDVKSVDDKFFAKSKVKKDKKDETAFFDKTVEMSAEEKQKIDKKRSLQSTVDASLIAEIKKVEHMRGYLNTRFTLR